MNTLFVKIDPIFESNVTEERMRDRGREKEAKWRRENLPKSGSLHKYLQRPGLDQDKDKSQEVSPSLSSGRDPRT